MLRRNGPLEGDLPRCCFQGERSAVCRHDYFTVTIRSERMRYRTPQALQHLVRWMTKAVVSAAADDSCEWSNRA